MTPIDSGAGRFGGEAASVGASAPLVGLSRAEQAHRLVIHGADYALHAFGDWWEVSSHGDGMCGRVDFENARTTEVVAYHWDVHSECYSQDAARAAAREDFRRGVRG